ncbi:MAG TPA: GNAT family N-acetyltransferase [Candidatus Eremiobacteraceae bacterium]|nr:GNAT family N-acetyltransferase [Candidatus Eremiobacteraceae bacterium]
MLIRSPETADDIRALVPLFDAYRVFYEAASDTAGAQKFLYDRWRLHESVLFIAYDAGVPQGFVQLFPVFSSVDMQRIWILNDLFVQPSNRRSGIGRALVRRAEQHARDTGSAGLTLSTASDNASAQALYESERYARDSVFCVYNRVL